MYPQELENRWEMLEHMRWRLLTHYDSFHQKFLVLNATTEHTQPEKSDKLDKKKHKQIVKFKSGHVPSELTNLSNLIARSRRLPRTRHWKQIYTSNMNWSYLQTKKNLNCKPKLLDKRMVYAAAAAHEKKRVKWITLMKDPLDILKSHLRLIWVLLLPNS